MVDKNMVPIEHLIKIFFAVMAVKFYTVISTAIKLS